MFKCEKCDSKLEPNAKFCTNCGESVSENIKTEMKNEQPSSKVKTWVLKAVAFFIAAIVFTIARVIFTAINGGSIDGKLEAGGILLFIGMYILLKGLFLKDSSAKKTGGWILVIYIVLSIAFTYYLNNSSYGIDEQLRQMSYKAPIKIDKDTELSKVTINGNNVTFKYKLKNISKNNLSSQQKNIFRTTIKDELCKDKDFIKMIKHDKKITVYYYDMRNYLISQISLSTAKCR